MKNTNANTNTNTELATIEYGSVTLASVVGSSNGLPLDQNPAAVYLASLRPTGRRSMQHYLDVMAEMVQPGQTALTLPWGSLRYHHTAAIRMLLQERYKSASANTALAALRRVLREAKKLGQLPAADYENAIEVAAIKGETLLRGRALAGGELSALLAGCGRDQSPAGARDAALIAVAYGAGLRRSEVVKLDLADYDPTQDALKVLGAKGNKDRLTYLSGGSVSALADWLVARGNDPGPLFLPIRRGGHIQHGKRLSDQAVLHILKHRAALAGVNSFSPHDLRRTFISDLLDAGADIATAQKLAGHASVTTTARYDRRGEAAKKKAAGMLHLPYNRG